MPLSVTAFVRQESSVSGCMDESVTEKICGDEDQGWRAWRQQKLCGKRDMMRCLAENKCRAAVIWLVSSYMIC